MYIPQPILLDLLEGKSTEFTMSKTGGTSRLSSKAMADLYVESAMFATSMEYLQEQLWLKKREEQASGVSRTYQEFLAPLLEKELLSLFSFQSFLVAQGSKHLKMLRQETSAISSEVLTLMMDRPRAEQKTFLIQSLKEMSSHFLYEEGLQEGRLQSLGHLGPCLYRTFDGLDEVFEINYQLDRDMKREIFPKERLYQGAGVSVQSGYSTILLALHHLQLQPGSQVVDLGSGYGRVGLVCALLHPEVDFVGYEYVPHRVAVSNRAADFLALEFGLHFVVQDLSLPSFRIPRADVFYLYDPFTDETYQYIVDQIIEASQSCKVTVVTKGNARNWFLEVAERNGWPTPLFFDERNLCLFQSA